MTEESISFIISPIPIRINCPECKKFITQGRYTVLLVSGEKEQLEYSFVGELRRAPCCDKEIPIPLVLASYEHCESFVCAQYHELGVKTLAEVKKTWQLTAPSQEFLDVMFGNNPHAKSMELLYSDVPCSDSINTIEGVGLCSKHLH